MNDEELRQLRHIRETYGDLISAAAARHGHRPEVVAGIMMRESGGGLSAWLDKPGPEGRGDAGHGHGLMQIDDRSFSDYCGGEHWKEPANNIDFGCCVLASKRAYLEKASSPGEIVERAAIAAYNCGEGNVRKAIAAGADVDLNTTGHDYSRAVLVYAEAYRNLAAPEPPPPEPEPTPEPQPPQAASVGLWGSLIGLLMKIFIKRDSPRKPGKEASQ
jgi:hypothetical protein